MPDVLKRPPTTRQEQIIALLRKIGPMTATEIGYALGFSPAPSQGGIGGGRGSGAGTGVAQRVIGSLNGPKRRGLVRAGGGTSPAGCREYTFEVA